MADESSVPSGRLSRLARLAGAGLRLGAAKLTGDRGDSGAQQTAQALGRLRGLAAKLGQMASYVDGVVPEGQRAAYEEALAPLMSQAARSPAAAVRRQVEEELDAPIDELFARWEDEPIASASIGQVHRAVLRDGRAVAVKVQHPGIVQALESDLANAGLLENAAGLLGGKRFNSQAWLAVLRQRFREELDYLHEARRQKQFAQLHAGDARIHIPTVIDSHSGRRVLTTEFVEGIDFAALCEASVETRQQAAATLWRFVYKGINHGGLFNADPHPGNYKFQPDGRIAFLDFGCVQELTITHRNNARQLHRAAMTGDPAFASIGSRMVEARPGRLERMAVAYLQRTFLPVTQSPYRITRPFAASLFEEMRGMAKAAVDTPPEEFFTLPADSLFMNRLHFGFYSLLARLDVEVDYRAEEELWFQELPESERM